MIIFHKNVINVDVARSLKLLINCNIFYTCWYDIRIDDICLIVLQQTLLIHIHGTVISSLHRVPTASVNSYTLNIAQVNPFMKVFYAVKKYGSLLFSFKYDLGFLFCLKTNSLSIQVHFYKRMCYLDTFSSSCV